MYVYVSGCVVIFVIWSVWKLYVDAVDKRFRDVNNGKPFPGPSPSFLGLEGMWVYIKGSINGLCEEYAHYGPVIRVFVGPSVWVIPTVLDHANDMHIKKSFPRGILSHAFTDIVPGSILVTEGKEWRRHRLAMNPFFAKEEVEKFAETILEIAKQEYDELEIGKPFHLSTWTNMMISRILMKTFYNVTVDKKDEADLKRFIEAVNVMNLMGDWIGLVVICNLICPAIAKTERMKKFIQRKTTPFKEIIKVMKENPNPDSLWKQLATNGKFTWEEFENESMGILVAGFETTSYSLSWVLHSLTKYPSIKLKLKQEIDTVLGGRSPTPKDLDNLPYLEKFTLETIRYHAIILLLNKTAAEQETIGEYQIPKGTTIFESVHYYVRNAFDDPERFDPDRFTDENKKELSKVAMRAFGTGPHSCPGKYLAIMEMKLITVFLLQQNGDLEVDIKNDQWNPHLPTKAPMYLTAKKIIQILE